MKQKTIFIICLSTILISCGPSLNEDRATDILKSTFHLGDHDKIEILGISKDSNSVLIIKARINDKTLNSKIRKYNKGWQVDEIQNDLGAWLPASSIENIQQDKLKVAMLEIMTIATALADYITDNGKAPKHSGPIELLDNLDNELVPFYVDILSKIDPWGNKYLVYCGIECNEMYGLSGCAEDDMLIVSYGSDGVKEDWIYDDKRPEAGLFEGIDLTKDLVNWNGSWIRAPKINKNR